MVNRLSLIVDHCLRAARATIRAMTRSWLLRATLVTLVTSASIPASADAPLSVQVSALRNDRGRVGCALYSRERGFPTEPAAAAQLRWCTIANRAARCEFAPIAAGVYAVACFHDENANNTLDRGLFGIPIEGTVVSNHARGFMGPPPYSGARFTFAGQPAAMSLRMSY